MNAVASSSTFRGFSPPAWIFSHDSASSNSADAFPPQPTSILYAAQIKSHSTSIRHRPNLDPDEPPDEDANYGPTLKRRGNVRFVRAKLVDEQASDKGKGREMDKPDSPSGPGDKGEALKGFYESIVGVQAQSTAPSTSARPPPPRPALPIADLVLSSDSDSSDDDEILIVDSLTGLTSRPPIPVRPPRLPRRPQPKLIPLHQLLLPPTAAPLVPPIAYGIKPTNIGWKLLQKQGWKEGQGLGPNEVGDSDGGGLKVPLKASEKFDRKGLGGKKEKKNPGEDKRRKEADKKRERGALEEWERGGREAVKKARKDEVARKELLAYLNS
ncbi:hypothetical protein P7C70_g8828, partial [Phenoliferia sp. Uapishka_3]